MQPAAPPTAPGPVIDAHAHLFSRVYFETLAAQSPLPGTVEERLARVTRAAGIELPSADLGTHVARWLADMDRHGVEHLCTFASVGQELPTVVEAVALARGRMTGFALVDPRAPGVLERVRPLLEQGAIRGVLLFPALHHYRLDDPVAAPLLAAVAACRGLVYAHCGLLVVRLRDLLGLPRTQDLRCADPLHVIPAAHAHAQATFVIPHLGAGFFRETLFAGAQCPNVVVDTSSSNAWMATQAPVLTLRDVLARALDVLGPRRVLFGTDSNVLPAGWRRDRLDEQRAVLRALGTSAEDEAAFLRGNAARLLGRG